MRVGQYISIKINNDFIFCEKHTIVHGCAFTYFCACIYFDLFIFSLFNSFIS
jgi:hypothetical protein